MIKKLHYLPPFFIALAPAIFLWSNNFAGIFPREVFPTLVAIIVFAGIVLGVFWLFYRNLDKAAIVASVFLLFLFSFQYIFYNDLAPWLMRYRWAFLLCLFIIIGAGYAIKKTKRDLSPTVQVITIVSGVFILISLLQLGGNLYVNYKQEEPTGVETVATSKIDQMRDIYYIILDEYSAPWVLKEVMGFEKIDQTATFLKERGFFLAELSQANYSSTDLSLASSLNMRYLDETERQKIRPSSIEDHFLKDFFRFRGYQYLHFGADWTTYFNRYADENINIYYFSPYQMVVWETTAFAPLERFLGGRGFVAKKFGFLHRRFTQWQRVQFKLEELAKVPERKEGPIFVFAHFLIPHGPYVFDADGNFLTKEEVAERSEVENYLGQVEYINKEMEVLVDELLEKSEPEPIIIIQGDHGFRFPDDPELLEDLSLESDQAADLAYPILNAYYFPDGGDEILYESITPVNSFRVLLNYYFDQELDLLEDKTY